MRPATRSTEATTTAEVVAVARARRATPSGVWGMLLFAATEGTLFGTLLATYFYLRFRSPQWPPPGIEAPSVALPLALTAALVATTVPILLSVPAARRGRRGLTAALVALAMVVQGGYLAWQIVLYTDDLAKFTPDDSAYGSIYFTLLGAHHAHVAFGLLLDLWVLVRLASGLTNYRLLTVQAVALYWAFVNAVAILVVAAQVSPS
jgi:heme/copper-type cytochrome/quinol oxidase subunit 3